MGYLGNLTCADCGLTFTASWGGGEGVDEYRCSSDHIVEVGVGDGGIVAVDGAAWPRVALSELRGLCPRCGEELATGLLPRCPVCGSRDHEVLVAGTF